jgi:hypothetical protein
MWIFDNFLNLHKSEEEEAPIEATIPEAGCSVDSSRYIAPHILQVAKDDRIK